MSAAGFPTPAYTAHLRDLGAMTDDERLAFVIARGRAVDLRTHERVRAAGQEMSGCQARVWIAAERGADGRLAFAGSSDAAIVQGLVDIMTESFSGLTRDELKAIGLEAVRAFPLGAMTTHRQVGMMAMFKHMQRMETA